MEKKETYECSFCLKQFSTKGTLNIHQNTAKYCLEKQGKVSSIKCNYCNKNFGSIKRLDEHLHSCKQYIDDIKNEHNEYKIMIESFDKEKKNLIESYEKQIKDLLREMLDKSNNTIAEIAKQPKTTNIKTQNNTSNIQNILTDYKTYEENTSREHILSLANDEDIEEYFWKGQRGVAEFVCDRIAKTKDGKMILCCTDPTRSRFKYKNASDGISEDIDAHLFNKKISEPIKKIYNDVHNNIQKALEEQTSDYSKTDLEYKKDIALEKNTEIQMISNPKENGEYRRTIAMHLKV